MSGVYVFSLNYLPSGVFTTRSRAERWIAENRLTGMLTLYPVDEGAYRWAIRHGLFTPKKTHHLTPTFIARFANASMDHWHYEDGIRVSGNPGDQEDWSSEDRRIQQAVVTDWYDGPTEGALKHGGTPFLFDVLNEDHSKGPRVFRLRPFARTAWRALWDAVPTQELRAENPAIVILSGQASSEEEARMDRALDDAEASADVPVALAMDWESKNVFAGLRRLGEGESPRTLLRRFSLNPEGWRQYFQTDEFS